MQELGGWDSAPFRDLTLLLVPLQDRSFLPLNLRS